MILSAHLKLDKYIDITIIDSYDETDDAVFVCDVNFDVNADESGLYYDVSEVLNPNITYTGIMHTESELDDEETQVILDLSDYTITIHIERDNDDRQNMTLDSVNVDITKNILKIYFIN